MTTYNEPNNITLAMILTPFLPLFRAVQIIGPERVKWLGPPPRTEAKQNMTSWALDGERADHATMMKMAGLPEVFGQAYAKGPRASRYTNEGGL